MKILKSEKMKRETLFAVVLSLFIVISLMLVSKTPSKSITGAFMVSATNLNITGGITGGGYVNLTGGSLKLKVAVGQPIVGNVSNQGANLKICFGVFCTIGGAAPPPYIINFTGQLNYSNGTAVANQPITAYITYLTNTYSNATTTDNNGKFLIVISNLPKIENKDFDVKFYVSGEIEATYECTYDHNTDKCCPSGPPCP